MRRANRHFLANHIWHITHLCHNKEFLLSFSRDRRRWMSWLYEARKRFGLCVLNDTVTSHHVLGALSMRAGIWPESLAVGSEAFGEGVKAQFGIGGHYRQVQDHGVAQCLKEPELLTRPIWGPE